MNAPSTLEWLIAQSAARARPRGKGRRDVDLWLIRKKWIIKDGATTVVHSDALLRGIQEVIGKR